MIGNINKLFVFKPKHFIIAPSNVCMVCIFRWLCYKAMILKFVPKSWARLYKSKSDLKLINQIGSFFSVVIPSHLLCKMQCHKDTDINQLKVAKFQNISSSASKLIKTYTKTVAHILAIWILSLFLIWKYVVKLPHWSLTKEILGPKIKMLHKIRSDNM